MQIIQLAEDFGLPEVVKNEASDSLQDVFRNMSRSSANYSIISESDSIIGIVTYRDIMKLLSMTKKEEDPVQMYIVGLPDDPFEANAIREKFTRAIHLLTRSSTEITEARVVIKKGKETPRRRKYQVNVFIDSPSGHWNYRVTDYDLLQAFEHIDSWAKGLLSRRRERFGRVISEKRSEQLEDMSC